MATPASEEALGGLHVIVAEALTEIVQDKEQRTAAHINAAIKFLADNNIQATRGASKALDALAGALESTGPADDAELQAALDNIVQFPGSVANGA